MQTLFTMLVFSMFTWINYVKSSQHLFRANYTGDRVARGLWKWNLLYTQCLSSEQFVFVWIHMGPIWSILVHQYTSDPDGQRWIQLRFILIHRGPFQCTKISLDQDGQKRISMEEKYMTKFIKSGVKRSWKWIRLDSNGFVWFRDLWCNLHLPQTKLTRLNKFYQKWSFFWEYLFWCFMSCVCPKCLRLVVIHISTSTIYKFIPDTWCIHNSMAQKWFCQCDMFPHQH